jgi:hypothetical protein
MAPKHSAKKTIQPPWTSMIFVFVGGYMLFLQARLTPVSCGTPQALSSIYRGGNKIICAQGNEISFTGGLSRVYGILRECIDAHRSLDLWLYKLPRAGETHVLQASCNGQIVLPYSEGIDAYQTTLWLHIVLSCAVLVGGIVTLGIWYRRRMIRQRRASDHGQLPT